MNGRTSRSVEETRAMLEDHVDDALEHATDEDAVFHLRHAKQLLVDYPNLVERRADDRSEAGARPDADEQAGADD